MNWDWAASLDNIWRSPNLPLYLTLATAGFVGIIVLITLLRSERSVANGVLALITLLAIGAAGAVTFATVLTFRETYRAPFVGASAGKGATATGQPSISSSAPSVA